MNGLLAAAAAMQRLADEAMQHWRWQSDALVLSLSLSATVLRHHAHHVAAVAAAPVDSVLVTATAVQKAGSSEQHCILCCMWQTVYVELTECIVRN